MCTIADALDITLLQLQDRELSRILSRAICFLSVEPLSRVQLFATAGTAVHQAPVFHCGPQLSFCTLVLSLASSPSKLLMCSSSVALSCWAFSLAWLRASSIFLSYHFSIWAETASKKYWVSSSAWEVSPT